jgi:hypothetical protein
MSKTHASLSFILSILFCIFGFCILAYTVSIDIQQATAEPVIIGIIGGTISELFAGTALFVHKSSLTQLNFYYKALHENERLLLSIHLVDALPKEEQSTALKNIINSSLEDIKHIVKNEIK